MPWEEGYEEASPPTKDQFREWLDSEPAFDTWAKTRTESAEMKQIKKQKREKV